MTFTRREPRGILAVTVSRNQLPAELRLSSRYRPNAPFHSGIWMRYLCKLVADRTEYAGRGAGRAICALLVGRTSVFRPAPVTISFAKSNHVHSPALQACTIPHAFAPHRSIIAFARSTVQVGDPR